MKLHFWGAIGLSVLMPGAALADFQYQETTQITGGSMLGLMKMAGAFSSKARQAGAPTVSTVYVQGNRMARVGPTTMEIIDLDKGTITNVDLDKHSYTEMTFEQMRQQMEKAVQNAKEQQAKEAKEKPAQDPAEKPSNVDVKFKVNVRNTGANKQVSGLTANEAILTMQMEGTDKDSGQKGAMAITNDMWMAPEIPGYDEVREFNRKLALKMGYVLGGSGLSPASMAAMQPGAMQGMRDMADEIQKLKGIPMQQVMRMGATANGEPLPAASEAPLPPSSNGPQMPSAGDVAQQSATSAIASKLGGFGGFGGFGRKKKDAPPAEDANEKKDAGADAKQQQTASVLIEMQTEMNSFGSSAIDPAKFAVPAGFKQIPVKE